MKLLLTLMVMGVIGAFGQGAKVRLPPKFTPPADSGLSRGLALRNGYNLLFARRIMLVDWRKFLVRRDSAPQQYVPDTSIYASPSISGYVSRSGAKIPQPYLYPSKNSWATFAYSSEKEKEFWDKIPDWSEDCDPLNRVDSNGSKLIDISVEGYTGFAKAKFNLSSSYMSRYMEPELIPYYIREGGRGVRCLIRFENGWVRRAKFWFASGKVFSDSFFKDGRRHGSFTEYDFRNKSKTEELTFKQGKPDGLWIKRDQLNRGKSHEVNYRNGQPDGLCVTWSQGKRLEEFSYKDGKRHGMYRYWKYGEEVPSIRCTFENDKLSGLYSIFNDGQKIAETFFKGGIRDGVDTLWHENGQKKRQVTWKNGKLEGLANGWHENGQKAWTTTWKDGKREGLANGWHENGQKAWTTTWKNGKREGLANGWHENGQKQVEGIFKANDHGIPSYCALPSFRSPIHVIVHPWEKGIQPKPLHPREDLRYICDEIPASLMRLGRVERGMMPPRPGKVYVHKTDVLARTLAPDERIKRQFPGDKVVIQPRSPYPKVIEAEFPDGVWVFYYESGRKYKELSFRDGILNGPCSTWHENGHKWMKTSYNKGIWEGTGIIYYQDGTELGRITEQGGSDEFAKIRKAKESEAGVLNLHSHFIRDITPLAGLTKLTNLNLSGGQITDLSPLKGLTNLDRLNLWGDQITDLSPLSGLTNLDRLYLRGDQITDLTPLAGLTKLTNLNLSGGQITDLSPLKGLTNLDRLYLRTDQITDLSPLAGLTKLEELSLYKNQITDLSPLKGLTNLEELYLYKNQISDLSPLAGLTQLARLNLSRNQISDLSPLSGLTKLEMLSLGENQISEDQKAMLKKALPNCDISF
jgi:antitoxin component YwqK of YwqJK toxin-antitoxin module